MKKIFHKDYALIVLIGFLVGMLVLVPLKNIGINVSISLTVILVLGFTLFAPFAFWILTLLSVYLRALKLFAKFAAVGTLNILLNLSIVNLFIFMTSITKGFYFGVFTFIAFFVTKISSYMWNKFWTFEDDTKLSIKEYLHFTFYTIVGLIINVGIISFLVNVVSIPYGIDEKQWANIAVLFATIITFLWNFLSYKNIVFKYNNNV